MTWEGLFSASKITRECLAGTNKNNQVLFFDPVARRQSQSAAADWFGLGEKRWKS
jgi:hypothetical protein